MAVAGGVALAAWKHARFTRDADLLIAADQSQLDQVLNALQAAGFYARHTPPVMEIDEQRIVQLGYLPPDGAFPFQLDLLLARTEHQTVALSRSVPESIPGLDQPLQVLRPDDLILLKLTAGRIIDRADAAMLLRENRAEIDLNYLAEWSERLGVVEQWSEIWRETFPEEPLPNSTSGK